jgi:hypothetical protein
LLIAELGHCDTFDVKHTKSLEAEQGSKIMHEVASLSQTSKVKKLTITRMTLRISRS